ncbi:MAG TPA: hypothetical protein PK812_09005 [Beijerinckiaceae bacterium]|nr:hypothetical protein [Beijerinckiaceae bacterium]
MRVKKDARSSPPANPLDGAQEGRLAEIRIRTWAAVDALVARGAAVYQRNRDLPRLLPKLGSADWHAGPLPEPIIEHLKHALVRERALGQCGHRAYNLARHLGLVQALKAEREALACTALARS